MRQLPHRQTVPTGAGTADAVATATEREYEEQDWLRGTADFREGTKAMADRRLPNFEGR